jgi:uncharacterized protein YndB with AHSA1/START domain
MFNNDNERRVPMTNPDTAVPSSDADLRITRSFNAPRELVYKTMTETEHLQHRWGPPGSSITVKRNEPRPGGIFHYCMHFPGGVEMWGRFLYRELTPPERIVFVNGFADPEGNAQPNPMSPGWPMEMLITNTLTEEEEGKTVLTMLSQPINATELERATFRAGHISMQGGFGGMYDVYEQYLATLQAKGE